MLLPTNNIRIAVFAYFMNAGGTMRAIEIARGIQDEFRANSVVMIRWISGYSPTEGHHKQATSDT